MHFILESAPYLFTKNLHYSYGTNKGRNDANGQFEVNKLNAADLAASLEKYEFNTIIINRKGYDDKGVRLVAEISVLNKEMLAENGDLVAFKLNLIEAHEYPMPPLVFGAGWSSDEGSHRWAISICAEVKIINNSREPIFLTLDFSLITLKPRIVDIILNREVLRKVAVDKDGAVVHSRFSLASLRPGVNTLLMETDVPPESPVNGDPRKLSFGISDIKISQ